MSITREERPPRMGRPRKLIGAPETFRRLEISPSTGYKAIDDGTMPVEPIKVGGQWKFRAADVDRVVSGADPAAKAAADELNNDRR